jgi:hypothetical protein
MDSLLIPHLETDEGDHYHVLKNSGPAQLILDYHPEINTIVDIIDSDISFTDITRLTPCWYTGD